MSTFMHAEPRRSYSWWWGSHISPKNSKWLQENLTDMDLKVKAMIKLIEEDADSFARRAEMFYKKRPELIKYVEDIYRAYRALSERYDHATGALRHAHRTIAETFPNHIPLALPDEPPISPSTEMVLCTPETPSPLHLFNPDDLQKDALGGPGYFHIDNENVPYADQNDLFEAKKGLKQLKELFAPRELTNRVKFHEGKARKGLIFQEEEECVSPSQLSIQKEKENANIEIERLQEEVSLLSIENQRLKIQIESQSMCLDSSRTESQTLRDTITKLESEMEAAFFKNQQSCERICSLESEVLKAKYEFEKLHEEIMMEIVKLCSAEEQCRSLMKENQNLKFEFEQTKDVLEEVRELSVEKHDLMKRAIKEKENADNETKRFHKQLSLVSNDNKNLEIQVLSVMKLLEKSRAEVQSMRIAMSKLESEKEAAKLMSQLARKSLSSLETDNFEAKEELGKLHAEILLGIIMLCSAEEQHFALESSNERLKLEHEEGKKVLEEIQMLSIESQHLLEQEVNEKVIIKNEIECLQVEVSQLTVDNQNMKSQIASMSMHLDAYRAEVQHLSNAVFILEGEKEDALFKNQLSVESLTSLEDEVFTANDEILKLHEEVLIGIIKLCSVEEQYLSLRSTKHCLKLEIEEQKTMLEDLIISLQESDKQLVEAKKSFQSLERQYSLSQEKARHMNLEFQTQLEKFQDIEHSKIGLEEKVHQLEDINYSLNEHIIIYDSKLKLLQNEIVSLKETNNKVEDEIKINLVNNRLLQQELDSVKDDRYELNLKHKSLIEQMEVASLNMESLEILIKELQFGCTELKDGCKKLEDEKLVFFNKLQDMEEISERNVVLQNALSDAVDKIRALENSCESLTAKDSTHAVEMAASLSQMKAIFDNLQKLSDKNSILENFLADANTDLEGLRLKLNESEESIQFLSNQNSSLLLQRNALISQVESNHCCLKNLETKYAMLNTSHLNLKEEKGILAAQVMELHDALKFQKKDQESLIQSSKLCLFSLENQIHLLQEDERFKEEELDTAHQEIMSNVIEILVLQRCLCDMKDSFNAEKLKQQCLIQSSNIHLSSLENQINLMQEKGRVRDKKLEEQQHKYLSAKLEIFILQKCLSEMEEKNFVRFQESQKLAEASRCAGELIFQLEASKLLLEEESSLLLDHKAKVKDGIDLLLESLDINKKMNIDRSEDAFLQIILRDVNNLLACISDANEENLLLHIELSVYLIFLKQNTLEKVLLGHELERTEGKLLVFLRDRDQLFEGYEKLRQDINDKDHTNKLLEIELESLRRLLSSLLKEFSNLKDEKSALEEENNALLNEAMNLEYLCLFLKSANAENLQNFEDENNVIISTLVATKNVHESYIKKSEEKLKAVENENKRLKDLHELLEELRGRTTLLEFDLFTTKNFCEEQNVQIEVGKNLLRKKSMELDSANHEADKTNIQFEEKISVLLEGHACKDAKIINIYKENQMLNVELNRFKGMIEVLSEREQNLSSELQKKICEADEYEEEITNLLNGIHVSVVIGMILEDKMLEWAITYERLRICSLVQWEMLIEEVTLRNSHEFILQKKLHDLEKENTELKAKWNSCLPLFSSLENGIAAVDNQVHQLANLQNYQDKSNNQTNKDDLGTISGAIELQNLLSKLEAIVKLLLHTNSQLKQEKHLQAFENLEPLKRGIGGLKLETSDRQAAQSEEPSIVKNGQLMKDIELDQISSSNIVSRIQSAESEDQMLKLWETAEKDCRTERAHDFKTGINSEKEVGVDKQEISMEIKEARVQWIREVIEGLSAGAERLSVLKVTCLKLSLKADRFGKSKRLKCSEPNTIQTKLKQAKEEILSLADIVFKMRKRVEEYSKSFEKMARLDREQVWEQMVMILDRIEKLEKEMGEMKLQGARTFRVLLWDYILGWRVKQGRKKRGHFCGCIRPQTQE